MKSKLKNSERLILTDIDGCVLDWEWAFNVWMQEHGFEEVDGSQFTYDMAERYNISREQIEKLIRIFNESAAIGFLPALRDAVYYIKRLHEEHGFRFHAITSLSREPNAQKLRAMNLRKLFGKTVFEKITCLDTGAAKDSALSKYQDTGCWWIEDKIENAESGVAAGLRCILMEHGHNMSYQHDKVQLVKNWRHIYELVTA